MYVHPDLLAVIARRRVADLVERGADVRAAAQAQPPQAQEPVGQSYRLPDGSWLHLRHDSA